MILLAKNVDGIYDSDPKLNPDAKKYDDITYKQVLADDLAVHGFSGDSALYGKRYPNLGICYE